MQARTVILIVILGAIALFAALNWPLFITPSTLSLGVTEVHAPLGIVMLSLMGLLTVVFLLFVVYLQTSVLLEARRHAREMQTQRELADKAEASRFTELRTYLDGEMQALRNSVDQSTNSLAAMIGELDDRVGGTTPSLPLARPLG
jgi:hypothetical protein